MMIGKPLSRIEGRREGWAGRARYSGDVTVPGMLYGAIVGAPVAAGKIKSIDGAAALQHPGVVRVITRVDMPRFGRVEPPAAVLNLPLQTDDIHHEGEPVAIVFGESIEAAEGGAALVKVSYTLGKILVPGKGRRSQPEMLFPLGQISPKATWPLGSRRPRNACSRPTSSPRDITIRWSPRQRSQSGVATCSRCTTPCKRASTFLFVGAALGIPPENIASCLRIPAVVSAVRAMYGRIRFLQLQSPKSCDVLCDSHIRARRCIRTSAINRG